MTPVYLPGWFAAGALLFAVALIATRAIRNPALRLGARCLVLAVVVTPQPLWAPGDGGYVLPAVLLLSPRHPGFALLCGLMPVLAVAGILFTIGGYVVRLRRDESAARAHTFVQRWVVVGVVLPFLALMLMAPFLAFFLFGGALACWSGFSLFCLLGGAGLDHRAARRSGTPVRSKYTRRTSAALFGLMLAVLAVGVYLRTLPAWA